MSRGQVWTHNLMAAAHFTDPALPGRDQGADLMAGRLTIWGAGELLTTYFANAPAEAPGFFWLALIREIAPTPYISGAELDEPTTPTTPGWRSTTTPATGPTTPPRRRSTTSADVPVRRRRHRLGRDPVLGAVQRPGGRLQLLRRGPGVALLIVLAGDTVVIGPRAT